jgi:hypothetical protein
MADQQFRCAKVRAQVRSGRDQIGDIRGEVRVGEFPFAGAESSEVEAQYADPVFGERLRDATCGENVFSACEAVRKQRVMPDRPGWGIQPRRQFLPVGAEKLHPLHLHRHLLNVFSS